MTNSKQHVALVQHQIRYLRSTDSTTTCYFRQTVKYVHCPDIGIGGMKSSSAQQRNIISKGSQREIAAASKQACQSLLCSKGPAFQLCDLLVFLLQIICMSAKHKRDNLLRENKHFLTAGVQECFFEVRIQ